MTKLKTMLGAGVLAAGALGLAAAVTAQQSGLGSDLTPMGATMAGNSSGTIPAWNGGIKSAADAGATGFKSGGHHPDPFAADKPSYKVDATNMEKYAANLTAGHKALLSTYKGSYFMNVYPSRRSAAFPQRIYDAVKANAGSAKLTGSGNGVTGAIGGPPFPAPKSGVEVIWNHILRYRADIAERVIGQAAVTRAGSYNMVKFHDETYIGYALPGATEAALDNVILYFIQETVAPARLAGEILLVHETLDQTKEHRKAWLYNPGQRRVRRAPNVAFDNPGTGSDGLRTSDQFDIYNGSPERYDWKLVGKQEIIVPYNAYQLHSNKLKNNDILKPLHINQQHARYEMHRVWVVDATLKPGQRHLYKRRTFYVDEDSWQILVVDCYDARDQLWRVQEGHSINYYEIPTFWTTLETTYDLQSGRYLALGLDNEEPVTVNFNAKKSAADFTPAAIANRGTR
ncbi:MAG TPA: DUF1329 domain-containing protein [Steroidobacteraceae bacterium]|jgi:hypothetical protein|nr:DUF1329 domain-containing protein [Steroidobacteraceae bacterium]